MTEAPDRRERKKQRTRLAIQNAAFELFAERGYRETTINAIADRADVAPRTVTVHFPTKEELLFDAEPFTLKSLVTVLEAREPRESALDTLRDWMASTMTALASPESTGGSGSGAHSAPTSSTPNPNCAAALGRLPRIRTRPRRRDRQGPRQPGPHSRRD